MDIEDFFEEWDEDKDDNDLAELLEDNVRAVNTTEPEDSEDEDESENEDDGSTFKCSKCKKRYHLKAWLQKHENSCSGKEPTKKCKVKLSEHQKKTRKVLSSLGFDDFFTSKCVPILITFLNKISATSSETAKIRGSRFTHAQQQAGKLKTGLEKEDEQVMSFFRYVGVTIWTIVFARDYLLSSSRKQQHIAQHLNEFRQAPELTSKWSELCCIACLNSSDSLLLQLMIGEIFGNISSFRHESVVHAMKIREECDGETSSKPFLTPLQKDVVAYISGYVCRKTRDRLQHYSSERFSRIVTALNQKLPGVKTQAPAMSYPNLMTLSLTRGGLTQVDHATYNFFCYLEVSVRPFLNLSSFRCSTRQSDSDILDQLINNSSLLKPTWPFSKMLPSEDSNLLLKLFVNLYFRVRKWAYLKSYKEARKLKASKCSAAQRSELHGKDSIRKALMSSTAIFDE